MKRSYNELEYAYAVGRLRVLETKMLTSADYEKLITADDLADAMKILSDLGWGSFDSYEDLIDEQINRNYSLIESMGGSEFLKIPRVKYDYHNIKVILKAELAKKNTDDLLIDQGNISAEQMKEAIATRDFSKLTKNMKDGIIQALEQYSRIPDGALVDIILDGYGFKDMLDFTDNQPDSFVSDMIKMHIDIHNIKTFIRVRKMGRDFSFMSKVIIDGGNISPEFFTNNGAEPVDKTAAVFEGTVYAEAFESGVNLEQKLDEIFMKKANTPRQKAFGLAPIAGYFWARENEILNVRIILTCKASGISADVIRQRLRGV